MPHLKNKLIDKIFHGSAGVAESVMYAMGGGKYGENQNMKMRESEHGRESLKQWRKTPLGKVRNAVRRAAGKEEY